MKKSFAIIGLGRFGLSMVQTLSTLKCDVIAIDVSEEAVIQASKYVNHCVTCDSTNINNLIELGLGNVDHAIVAIGNNFQATILATINLKELGIKQITVRVDTKEHIAVMKRLGATDVIIPEEASAISLANQIVSDSFTDFYKINKGYGMVNIKIRADFEAKLLVDLDLRNRFDINIVGIIRNDEFFIPKGVDEVQGNDVVLVIGKTTHIYKFDQYINNI